MTVKVSSIEGHHVEESNGSSFTMRLHRHRVPVGKSIVIGHDNENNCDFIGFIEPSDVKQVKLADWVLEEYADRICRRCDKRFNESNTVESYRTMYRNLFLINPETLIDCIENIGLRNVLQSSFTNKKHILYCYAKVGNLTTKQIVEKLLVYDSELYENFVRDFVYNNEFRKFLSITSDYIYKTFDKCKGFVIEGSCKLNKKEFLTRKVDCHHNELMFLQDLEDSYKFYLYDLYSDGVLAMPNVHSNGQVCWGSSNNRPSNLNEMYVTWWSTPFNGDLLWESSGSTYELIEGYGFDYSDFVDSDDDEDYYDRDPRSPNAREIIKIIENGGCGNRYKGEMDLDFSTFNVEGVKEILIVRHGRELNDFNELIDDDFLSFLCYSCEDVFIFLINEKEENVWDAYLPTNDTDGIYIEIDLKKLEESKPDETDQH